MNQLEGIRDDRAMLVELDGDAIRQQWPLAVPVTRIGRWPDNDIVVDDRWTSRHHAEIRREGGDYVLHDLGSKNGTVLNGKRLESPQKLHDGDQISVAPLSVLTFVDYAATAPLPGQEHRPLDLDMQTRDVYVRGKRIDPPLSQVQFDFLARLAGEPGRVLTRDDLIEAIWPDEDPGGISDDAINALVHRVRGRLRELDPEHDFIATVRGYGFRLRLPE